MDADGDRIRLLVKSRPEWVQSTLSDMGADPFTARYYGKKALNSQDRDALAAEIMAQLEKTKEPREERLAEQGRKRAKGTPAPRLPWGLEPGGH
jgi:hypothetical protein